MRRVVIAIALLLIAGVSVALSYEPATPRRGRLLPSGKLLIVVAPESAARELVPDDEGPSALVVSPPSRRARLLFDEISAGAPIAGATSSRPGKRGALGDALEREGLTIDFVVASRGSGPLVRYALDAFAQSNDRRGLHGPESLEFHRDIGVDLLVMIARTAADVTRTAPWDRRPAVLVVGVPDNLSTPVRVTARLAGGSVLGEVSTRRPGVATPYDVAATVLDHFGVARPAGFIGRPLRALDRPDDPGYLDSIAARFERGDDFAQSLTAWTIITGLGFGFVAAVPLVALGKREAAARLVTGASFATAGFLAGLFIPSSRGDVRAIPVVVGLILGAAVRPGDRRRLVATVFATVAVATAILTLAAAANPGGEPALSLWGNPLVSSRYFGLQNYQAAFIAGGVVVAAALGAAPAAIGGLGLLAGLVIGWPVLGANYVGVLTLAFGATIAVLVLRAGILRARHVAMAAAVSGFAFALALVAARIVGAGHGGRVAGEISSGGASAVIDVTLDRLRLNAQAIRAFPGGIAWTAAFVVILTGMIVWSRRDTTSPVSVRAGVAGGAVAAIAALVLEDSGFKTCAVLGFPALILWSLHIAENPRAVVTAVLGRRVPGDADAPSTPPPPRRR